MMHLTILEILLMVLVLVLAILYYTQLQLYKSLKETKIEDFTVETKKLCEEIKTRKSHELQNFREEVDLKMEQLQTLLSEKEARYNEVNQDLNLYKQGKLKEIDEYIVAEKARGLKEIKNTYDLNSQKMKIEFDKVSNELSKEIEKIKKELEIERSKRAAINEEILRQKKLQEQEDFYKIQLSPIDKPDIEILQVTAPRLRHPEAINKIIWSNYYQKPLAELRKRLLPNGDYSGVYKITRLKTGEIYIGQTTSIDKRFQDHVKSALGVGTLTSSQLHRTMAKDGPENFTFEIIEQVEKDKLKEREAYYINFYDSKNYGLNTIKGQEK